MNDEKLRRILEDKKLRMMLEEASPQQEIERLREVITRAASHWLNLHPGVAWEGDIADAMAAATAEIDTLREAIRRLAEQDATLSVVGGNVIVEMDNTSNDAVPAADGEGIRRPEGSRVRASASSIGNTQEPVAWAVMVGGRRMYVSWCREMCEDEAYYHRHPLGDSVSVVPLYRHRQPTLTDAEREAVEWALKEAVWSYSEDTGNHRATLRGLLERTKGGER